ncbi:multicopper oxidase family protein [Roseixanthobacter liquoris]|uniref:multicopper oxidase family protein n=1 Tax=Roseixanthobacter liquoris TaxID=3119921 RepID=UPI00372C3172
MNRRQFLNRMMAGAAAFGASATLPPMAGWAQAGLDATPSAPNAAPRPLAVTSRTLEVKGKAARVFGLAQPDGTPGLTLEAGSSFDVALSNRAGEPTLIHWHGLTPPWAMDGVPDNPAALLPPAETRRYTFPAGAGGTHWMHAHTLQEQNLLAAPLIVRTAADRQRDEQEVVILLHDFSFTPAEDLLAKLKANSAGAMPMDHGAMNPGGMNHGGMNPGTMNPGAMDHGTMNHGAMGNGGAMGGMAGMMSSGAMGQMHGGSGTAMAGMGAMDLNDVDYDAYLANDRTLDDPEVVTVEKGGRVRLRIINGATATAFTIDTGSLDGQLIAVDGQAVQPVAGRTFPISMGQRLDIRLALPQAGGAFAILALREGAAERAGVILASPGAAIAKIPVAGQAKGPVLGLDLEQRLQAAEPLAPRAADRRFALTLAGNMADYSWRTEGGDGLRIKRGERIEVALTNMSMMAHPMHLHGHHFQVIGINGKAVGGALRDTVLLPPMARVTLAFDADNPGRWPLHCHHLYHMASGMMTFVAYEGVG